MSLSVKYDGSFGNGLNEKKKLNETFYIDT